MPARTDLPAALGRVLLATLAATSTIAHAQAPQPAWPSDELIERIREARPLPNADRLLAQPIPRVPAIHAAPSHIDVGAMAASHAELGKGGAPGAPREPELRIFVSLAMPSASLRLLVDQAARTGAVLVLRGLHRHSMRQTLAAVQALIGDSAVDWRIDPEAFHHYEIEHAPTFVLSLSSTTAAGEATRTLPCTSGCTAPPSFVAVAGDVSLDHALNAIARQHPAATAQAERLLARMRVR